MIYASKEIIQTKRRKNEQPLKTQKQPHPYVLHLRRRVSKDSILISLNLLYFREILTAKSSLNNKILTFASLMKNFVKS